MKNLDPRTAVVPAHADAIGAAARTLADGGLVGLPTETVYGLAADAANGAAVARIFAAKGRPRFNPLIAHVASRDAAERLARFDAASRLLADAFWPGPLTLVLPQMPQAPVAALATAGLDTIAIRMPAHAVARAVIAALGRAVVAPSANRSGHVSPTTAAHVVADLGGAIDLVLDGGPTPLGLESTVVAVSEDGPVTLLRPGAISRDDLEAVLGRPVARATTPTITNAPTAPGMLASHYAPAARVRLDVTHVAPGEALLAFGPSLPDNASAAVRIDNLSPEGDLVVAAARLFGALRALDATGVATIAVAPIPRHGLGEAINDRLMRAAAPRGSSS